MLHAVIIVSVLATRACHAANSSTASVKAAGERAPAPLLAMVHAAQRPADLVSALRSQLMRDNYDYQNTNTDDERAHASQKDGNNYSYVPRTENDQENSNTVKSHAHKAPDTRQLRGDYKMNAAQKTAFRHNPIASGRAAEWHSPYDATYSSDTHVPLGPRYSPERGARHGSWAAPVVRAGSDVDAPRHAVQHPYPLPAVTAKSEEERDFRDVQKRTGGSFGRQKYDTEDTQPVKRRPDAQKREPIDHAIDKKDLLYYMDDGQLRRNNDLSAELDALGSASGADEHAYDHSHAAHHAARNRRAGAASSSSSPAPPAQPQQPQQPEQPVQAAQPQPNVSKFSAITQHEQHAHADASVVSLTDSSSGDLNDVVTGSSEARGPPPGANATYRVLRIGGRHGARRAGGGTVGGASGGARRLLEERDAAGLTLIRLDSAPFPQFHLPHARRQYMRERSRRRHRRAR